MNYSHFGGYKFSTFFVHHILLPKFLNPNFWMASLFLSDDNIDVS